MEWEYWLIQPSALGPPALGPWALLANIPTPLNFQLGNTDTVQYSTVQYTSPAVCPAIASLQLSLFPGKIFTRILHSARPGGDKNPATVSGQNRSESYSKI